MGINMERFREELQKELRNLKHKEDIESLILDAAQGKLIRGAESYVNNSETLYDPYMYFVQDDDSWLPALWDEATLDVQDSGVARVPYNHPANLIIIEEASKELQRRVN
jgi:hypothetical protein